VHAEVFRMGLCTRAADASAEVGEADEHRTLGRRMDVRREILLRPCCHSNMGAEILSALARCGPSLIWGRPFLLRDMLDVLSRLIDLSAT